MNPQIKKGIALLVWILSLFPFAMSGKEISIAFYIAFCISVFAFFRVSNGWTWRVTVVLFIAFILTFAVPVDLKFERGGLGFSCAAVEPKKPYLEESTVLGVQGRWILIVGTP